MEAFSIECRKTRTKEIMTESKSKFPLSVESNPWLIGFASLRSVTDLENSRQSLNQSNAKLKSIATW